MRIQNIQEVLTIDFRRPVPVFPLPDCVLFPHTLLPLHIYEPRYRKLVEDALDDIGLIALGLFEDMLSDDEYLRGR
ncbi:MAG: LON peptidase substrate-binding domain-containing protein, partial [Verrucomicrobia bacterium]|nr:LON peptidase substrate-binding domain-containing protein [Verrucomicrobiota bacterium]